MSDDGNEPITLTSRQRAATKALLLAMPAGFRYRDDQVEERRVLDELVEKGVAVKIEVEDGAGYQLSPEMFAAFGIRAIKKNAQQAALN
jgi:hypothetical protein